MGRGRGKGDFVALFVRRIEVRHWVRLDSELYY